MANSETVDRILDTAEELFAEKGFAETSLRTITSKADVNLASVNYHFGSKKALIQAVFARFLAPFCKALDSELDRHPSQTDGEPLNLSDLLHLLAKISMQVHGADPRRGMVFMRLIGLAYSQSQGHLRKYLSEEYGMVFAKFTRMAAMSVPELSPTDLYWRIHFGLGACVFAMSGISSLTAISESDFGQTMSLDEVARRLVSFVAGGIERPVS